MIDSTTVFTYIMATTNCYSHLGPIADDSILGLSTLFQKDPREEKANLTIGIFLDETGKLPLMKAVEIARNRLMDRREPHGYKPITGYPLFNQRIQELVFGTESEAVQSKRIFTAQGLGGTGSLHVGARFAQLSLGAKKGVASAPTWANHLMILKQAGYEVSQYPYFDPKTKGVDFAAMESYLKTLDPMTVVVLHACCHNPTGADLTKEEWQKVLEIVQERRLYPLLDIAYQGFGFGVDEDAYAPRLFAEAGIPFMVASSCSKNFGLYGERVGAIHFVTEDAHQADLVRMNLAPQIRGEYSNPPAFGAQVVAEILTDPELRQIWFDEVDGMRTRIRGMRELFAEKGREAGLDLDFATRQNGMFSFTGLTGEQMDLLMKDWGVYGVRNGRFCMAGLNNRNVDLVVRAIKAVS